MGRHRRVHSLNFEQDYRKVIDDKMRQSGDGLCIALLEVGFENDRGIRKLGQARASVLILTLRLVTC